MTNPPTIAFCTTCRGRAQHVSRTLPRNLVDNESYPNAKFIMVDYASQDWLEEHLRANYEKHIASGRLVVYTYRGDHAFRMAHAKNIAHRMGIAEGAEILVNMDADNYTGPNFAGYVAEKVKDGNTYLWARMVQGVMDRGICGRLVVPSQVFLKTGGYDEIHETWGHDDKDFHGRIRRLGCVGVEIDPLYLHAIRHNDKMRFREYPHVATAQAMSGDGLDHIPPDTIANYGKIGCATVYRNFEFDRPIELKPLPTRIFGIGLHKTATTSLHKALTILGYDSAHWRNAHWAKAIWREMSETGRSATIERCYALSDLPIPIMYRDLDKAYPGSKFILTMRDEDKWVRSVKNHWSHNYNRFRMAWDNDPFSHKVHKLLYGQTTFDETVMRERYQRHNWEVQAYFLNRPDDLRVMHMDGGAGWTELCGFLGNPMPGAPYPRELATPWEYGETGLGI
jgi:hypothetical protein